MNCRGACTGDRVWGLGTVVQVTKVTRKRSARRGACSTWPACASGSWHCIYKIPQAAWLKTTEIHSGTELEARSLRSGEGVGRAAVPLRRGPFLPLLALTVASSPWLPWLTAVSLQSVLAWLSVLCACVSVSRLLFLLQDTSHWM